MYSYGIHIATVGVIFELSKHKPKSLNIQFRISALIVTDLTFLYPRIYLPYTIRPPLLKDTPCPSYRYSVSLLQMLHDLATDTPPISYSITILGISQRDAFCPGSLLVLSRLSFLHSLFFCLLQNLPHIAFDVFGDLWHRQVVAVGTKGIFDFLGDKFQTRQNIENKSRHRNSKISHRQCQAKR